MLAWLHCNKTDSLLFFRPHWKSGRAKCAPVNEILVISIAHCLPPSLSTALLCIREELSVSLVLKEGNGIEPTKFHEGLPWPSRSNRPGWRGLIMWNLVCKKQWLEIKWRLVVSNTLSEVVLGLRALFFIHLLNEWIRQRDYKNHPACHWLWKSSQPEKFQGSFAA